MRTGRRPSGSASSGKDGTTTRVDWNKADPLNRALSAANACLHGVVQAGIITAGYSPAIGFIHTGKALSFVYDIADLYKVSMIVPMVFEVVSQSDTRGGTAGAGGVPGPVPPGAIAGENPS